MAEDKRPSWKEARQAERNRNLLMILIPVILVILVAVIVFADKSSDQKEKTTEAAASTETTAVESVESETGGGETNSTEQTETGATAPEETLPEETPDEETPSSLLSKDAVPEVNSLITKYLQARAACNAETIYQLYGRTGTNGLEEMRAKLLVNARYIQSFENMICYTAQGLGERTWIVITLVDIKVRSLSTMVPIAIVGYVVEDGEGGFILRDPNLYTEEEREHIGKLLSEQELIDLNAQVKSRVVAAMMAEPQLEPIIAYLNADSKAWETGETEPETEQDVQVLTE